MSCDDDLWNEEASDISKMSYDDGSDNREASTAAGNAKRLLIIY
jgi:hypothetical protein